MFLVKFLFNFFFFPRWKISRGCIDFTIKYLKAWILLPMYSSRLVSLVFALCFLINLSLYGFNSFQCCIMMIICLQHITVEGTSLVQQAEEATSNQVQHLLQQCVFLLISSASWHFQLIFFFSFSPDYKWFWLSGTSKSPHCFLFINYIIVMIAGKFWRLIMWHCRSLSVNF